MKISLRGDSRAGYFLKWTVKTNDIWTFEPRCDTCWGWIRGEDESTVVFEIVHLADLAED